MNIDPGYSTATREKIEWWEILVHYPPYSGQENLKTSCSDDVKHIVVVSVVVDNISVT